MQWRSQRLEGAAGVFGSEAKPEITAPAIDANTLHASDKLRLRRAELGFWLEEPIHRDGDSAHGRNSKSIAVSIGGQLRAQLAHVSDPSRSARRPTH